MEIRQLKYFVKVAETLNFSEAAKSLFVAQSALSQQIGQLEQELGVQLFQRTNHGVCLTEAGEELLPMAFRTICATESCEGRMQDCRQELSGTLDIGVTYTFSPFLTDTLLEFMKLYPQVKLNIHYNPIAELMAMLEKHEVDFVLAFKSDQLYPEIQSRVLFSNRLAVIVSEHHPLAQKDKVTLLDIQKYDFALPSTELQARHAFDSLVNRYCPKLRVRLELNEVHILLKLVRQSSLMSVLSEMSIQGEPGIVAIPIDVPDNEMKGCVHLPKNGYRKHAVQTFIRLLAESKFVRVWFPRYPYTRRVHTDASRK